MDIRVKSANSERVMRLRERYGISLLMATIFDRRGLEESDIIYYLEDEFIYQYSPFLVEDVYTAVDRINLARDEGERILIFGDRDVDGVTSSAILYRTLKRIGCESVDVRLPEGDESYGLTSDIVNEIISGGYTLVITVDNGISAVNEIKELESNGISVIVTDHHIPGLEFPPATAIFDPKIEGSGYPFENLAGCAVAAKLSWALLFSATPLYESDVILLHSEPGNGTIRISAVRLENLIEIERISEEVLIPENGEKPIKSLAKDKVLSFLAKNIPVIVLDERTERNMLRQAFGSKVDISLIDFRETLEKAMPRAKGHSLFDLSKRSKAARYTQFFKELETFISLFRSISIYQCPSLTKEFEPIMQIEAIGTIADLMPMQGENRLIVKKGLRLLSSAPNPCFFSLLNKQGMLNKIITARDISYRIAPVLNAAGRMGHPMEAFELLITDDYKEAETLTARLIERNDERKAIEESSLTLVESAAKESYEEFEHKFIFIDDNRIPRGLTGSLSSKLLSKYEVPVLVIADLGDRASASIRCKTPCNAREFLSYFSYLFDDFGGHRFAAGFSMDRNNIPLLKEEIRNSLDRLDSKDKDESILVDAQIPASYMNDDLWAIYDRFEPYGQENEKVKYFVSGGTIEDIFKSENASLLRGNIRYGRNSWPMVWWSCPDVNGFKVGDRVDFVFTAETNWWNGQSKEQIVIEKMEKNIE